MKASFSFFVEIIAISVVVKAEMTQSRISSLSRGLLVHSSVYIQKRIIFKLNKYIAAFTRTTTSLTLRMNSAICRQAYIVYFTFSLV